MKTTLKRFFPADAWRVLVWIFIQMRSLLEIARCACARIVLPEKTILVSGWFFMKNGRVREHNWGDDINISFFSESTGKRVVPCPHSWLARKIGFKNFVLIGSVISSATQRNSIVWGSGLINDKRGYRLREKPRKILAVRGPLTREWVLAQGVDCPPVFGDPALLLPRFYSPKKLPRSRVGLIPHHVDLETKNPQVLRLLAEPGVLLIRVQGYKNWRDFIDEICACDFVVSASLHGLIVAQAYGVPALWVEFCEHIAGWDFKFRDFYASLGKMDVRAVRVDAGTRLAELLARQNSADCVPVKFDDKPLMDACPIELHAVSNEIPFPRNGGGGYGNTVAFPQSNSHSIYALAATRVSAGFFASA